MRKARFPFWAILRAEHDALFESTHLPFCETMGLCSNP